jgi:hypothetical protein
MATTFEASWVADWERTGIIGLHAWLDDLSSGTGIAQPDPLTLTLYPGTAHVRGITEDPMLEEFAASIASTRLITGPSFERAMSPPMAPSLQDEAPTMAAALLAVADLTTTDSCVLRTPPPCPIQWAGGSSTPADPPSPEPLETPSSEVSDDTFQRASTASSAM